MFYKCAEQILNDQLFNPTKLDVNNIIIDILISQDSNLISQFLENKQVWQQLDDEWKEGLSHDPRIQTLL